MKIKSEVIILYNRPDTQGAILWRESEAGVLDEVNAVASALDTLGVVCRRHGVRCLDDVPTVLKDAPGAVVFNLVERLEDGSGAWNQIPDMCRAFGHPCTGSSSACLKLTQNKWHTKERLLSCGIPVPAACVVPPGAPVDPELVPRPPLPLLIFLSLIFLSNLFAILPTVPIVSRIGRYRMPDTRYPTIILATGPWSLATVS